MTNGSNFSSKLSILEEYQMVKFFQCSQTFKLWLLLDMYWQNLKIFLFAQAYNILATLHGCIPRPIALNAFLHIQLV